MKKLIGLIAIAMLCLGTALFASCEIVHAHTFSEEWTCDATGHWHAATCEHAEEKSGFDSHTFGEWGAVGSPEEGVVTMQRTCSVCKYTESKTEREHNHTFSEEWTCDVTGHWHAATCEHTEEKSGFALHSFGDGIEEEEGTAFVCAVCGYKDIRSSAYRVDSSEFKALIESANNFTRAESNGGGKQSKVYFEEETVRLCYYDDIILTNKGGKFVRYTYDADYEAWIKDTNKEQFEDTYNYNMRNAKYFAVLKNSFDDLRFDVEKKAYVADSLSVNGEKYINVYFAFENGKIVKIGLSYENGYTYAYTDFGSTVIEIPANAHEHTYSSEWTITPYVHYFASTCGHDDLVKDEGPHEFGHGVETNEGVKYTCKICGYYEVEPSEYMVTAKEYASILSESNIFRANETTSSGEKITFVACGNVNFYQSEAFTDYYIYDGTEYFMLCKDDEEDYWIKEACTQEIYEQNTSGWFFSPYLMDKFADFSYDVTTRSYKAEEIILMDGGNYSFKFRNISLSFEESKLTAVTLSFVFTDVDGTETVDVYTYSDIGTASLEIPTNIHEHTYSSEWSFNAYYHFHSATCKHSGKYIDKEDHTFIKGVCSVCGYNLLVLSDDGKTVIGTTDNRAKSVTIPQGVTAIGTSAFADCELTEIVIPEGVTSIGNSAFQGCYALVSVSLPEGLLTIGERAFGYCTALTSIKTPSTLQNIEYCSFSGCTNLQKVVLSEGAKQISNFAFKDSAGLTEICIPKSLTKIKENIFDGTSLSKIYYNGNESEWAAIEKSIYNNVLNAAKVYYYSESEPTEDDVFWHYVDGEITIWHKHSFSEDWSHNETSHWHASTCGHTDAKSEYAEHVFAESGETEEGTVYTCFCGYSETRASIYRVSEETFAELFNGAQYFRVTVNGFVYDCNNLDWKVQYPDGTVRYYSSDNVSDNVKYYKYYLEDGSTEWTKQEITRSEYFSEVGRMNQFPYIAALFNDLTYDINQKCYKGTKVMSGGNELSELLCYFKEGRLSEVEFVTQGIRFTYNEFDKVSVKLPENIRA